jgi:hypothetical protein
MAGIKIFVSVGRTSTPQQEEFVSAIESHMRRNGLDPLALGRNFYSSQQPLRAIDELMSQCSGVAIVGFERLRITHAVDRKGSDLECQLADVTLPSVWNQIEAAMGYTRGLPLLVLIQQELRAEGLLEPGYDWYVKRLPLGVQAIDDREFCGIFDDWHSRVQKQHAKRRQPSEGTAAQIGSSPTTEARADAPLGVNRRQLRLVLENRFSDDELRALCFDLGVDYENLPGATKAARAISIITYFERIQQAQELMRSVRDLRPNEL